MISYSSEDTVAIQFKDRILRRILDHISVCEEERRLISSGQPVYWLLNWCEMELLLHGFNHVLTRDIYIKFA